MSKLFTSILRICLAQANRRAERDPLTMELMETPGCWMKDIIGQRATNCTMKRYISSEGISLKVNTEQAYNYDNPWHQLDG